MIHELEYQPELVLTRSLKSPEVLPSSFNTTAMVFRLPTHLDSFVPPPSQQAQDQRPWRGSLIVSGMRSSDRSSSQTIRVTAVETDGDKVDLWPSQFFTQILHGRPVLKDLQAWVTHHNPPLCTFMPDRHRDPNINTVNQTTFRSLSRILFESQSVAIASWGREDIPGAGMIIFPAQNSSSLLVGALFLTSPFPSFITGGSPPPMSLSPTQMQMQPGYAAQYQQVPQYASSSRHQHQQSVSPPLLYPTSPVDDAGNVHGQYYQMPRTSSATHSSMIPTGSAWQEGADANPYANFLPQDNTHYQGP